MELSASGGSGRWTLPNSDEHRSANGGRRAVPREAAGRYDNPADLGRSRDGQCASVRRGCVSSCVLHRRSCRSGYAVGQCRRNRLLHLQCRVHAEAETPRAARGPQEKRVRSKSAYRVKPHSGTTPEIFDFFVIDKSNSTYRSIGSLTGRSGERILRILVSSNRAVRLFRFPVS